MRNGLAAAIFEVYTVSTISYQQHHNSGVVVRALDLQP